MKRLLLVPLALPLIGCRPAVPPPPPPAPVAFREVPGALDFVARIDGARPLNALQTIGSGCALLDADGDGNLDVLMVAKTPALFWGDGAGHFRRAPDLPIPQAHYIGCATGDYDGDGYVDLYLSAYRGGALLHNEAGKGFRDVTAASGIAPQPFGTACAWAETVPGSGRLDLIVANYARFGVDQGQALLCEAHTKEGARLMTSCPPRQYPPLPALVWRNQGGGRFRAERTPTTGRGLGVAAADADGTGAVQIAFANDEIAGDLLQRGPGAWRNVASDAGVAYDRDGNVHGGMGADWGDYDNDGRLDLVVATFHNELKSLYRNEGSGLFSDLSPTAGIGPALRPFVSFGVKFIDADNDGWLDLVVANGHVQDNIHEIDPTQSYRQPSALLRNDGGRRFVEIGAAACPALATPIVGRGIAVGDFDNDGRTDILLGDMEGDPHLLHNESPPRAWIGFSLEGTRSNRSGYGARVTVRAGGRTLVRHCHTDGSYLSASDPRVVVGLGSATSVDSVEIRWPSGVRQRVDGAQIGRYQRVREPR